MQWKPNQNREDAEHQVGAAVQEGNNEHLEGANMQTGNIMWPGSIPTLAIQSSSFRKAVLESRQMQTRGWQLWVRRRAHITAAQRQVHIIQTIAGGVNGHMQKGENTHHNSRSQE